jgi:hypothetical protein
MEGNVVDQLSRRGYRFSGTATLHRRAIPPLSYALFGWFEDVVPQPAKSALDQLLAEAARAAHTTLRCRVLRPRMLDAPGLRAASTLDTIPTLGAIVISLSVPR